MVSLNLFSSNINVGSINVSSTVHERMNQLNKDHYKRGEPLTFILDCVFTGDFNIKEFHIRNNPFTKVPTINNKHGLKPCPVCGGNELKTGSKSVGYNDSMPYVSCKCGISFEKYMSTEAGIKRLWNEIQRTKD